MVDKKFIGLDKPDITRFESYLPTAFSSELTLLQKVNKIIQDLNRSFDLTNEMVDYLNRFIESFDEKLYLTIEDILSKWLEDGILTELIRDVINEEVVEARDGETKLNIRLNRDKQSTDNQIEQLKDKDNELTTQLAQIVINVKTFGAKGDGVTDDSEAIISAINYAVSQTGISHNATVYFPTGTYKIKKSGVFSSINRTYVGGVQFKGSGWMNSILELDPTTEEIWFYDNTDKNILQFPIFEELQFRSKNSRLGSGFKVWSNGHDQGFKFNKCWFSSLSTMYRTDGPVSNSEHKFYMCKITYILNKVFYINNSQSVNLELFGVDVESIYGDVFYVGSNGGGTVKTYGGSFILSSDVNPNTEKYILNINGGNNVGMGNCDFTFVGMKTELHSDKTKLVKFDSDSGMGVINFIACNLSTVVGGTREAVFIGPSKTVYFDKCIIPGGFTYRVRGGNEAYAQGGHIEFINSHIPDSLSEKITFENGYGLFSALNCKLTNQLPSETNAVDFHRNWEKQLRGDSSIPLKTAVIKHSNQPFPYNNSNELKIKLPVGAVIKSIYINKPASGGSSSQYTLYTGNNDKTKIYGQSSTGAQKDKRVLDEQNIMVSVGSTENERILRVWADGGDTDISGGYAIVEYY